MLRKILEKIGNLYQYKITYRADGSVSMEDLQQENTHKEYANIGTCLLCWLDTLEGTLDYHHTWEKEIGIIRTSIECKKDLFNYICSTLECGDVVWDVKYMSNRVIMQQKNKKEDLFIYNSIDSALIDWMEILENRNEGYSIEDKVDLEEINYLQRLKKDVEYKKEILKDITKTCSFDCYITDSYIICDGRKNGAELTIYNNIDHALLDWLPTLEFTYGQEHLNEIEFIKNNCIAITRNINMSGGFLNHTVEKNGYTITFSNDNYIALKENGEFLYGQEYRYRTDNGFKNITDEKLVTLSDRIIKNYEFNCNR